MSTRAALLLPKAEIPERYKAEFQESFLEEDEIFYSSRILECASYEELLKVFIAALQTVYRKLVFDGENPDEKINMLTVIDSTEKMDELFSIVE